MAQVLALLFLLKRLMSKELSSFSSVGLNNFLFCILFLMSGSTRPKDAFWSTLLFQLILLTPMFVTFSVATQHRLPVQRVASWPLTNIQRLSLSSISFVLNPLFIALFGGFLLWMGFAVALVFVLLGLVVHVAVFAIGRLSFRWRKLGLWGKYRRGEIARGMYQELTHTLDSGRRSSLL